MRRYMAVAAASQKATSSTVKRRQTAADSDVRKLLEGQVQVSSTSTYLSCGIRVKLADFLTTLT